VQQITRSRPLDTASGVGFAAAAAMHASSKQRDRF
jgi:hypothetical protein